MTKQYQDTEKKKIFAIVISLILLSWTSIKIVLPALPGLIEKLHSSQNGINLSVTLFLLAFSLSQPVWGSIAHLRGRRITLLYGLLLSMIGSTISMFSDSITMYIIGRCLEGIGMGCISPVSRAVITDIFDKKELVGKIALIAGAAAAMPAISPIIGGYFMNMINWRAIFGLLLVLTFVILLICIKYLPETISTETDNSRNKLLTIIHSYFYIIKSRFFFGYIIPYSIIIGGLIGYYSASPFWFVSGHGIPEKHFSYLLLPTVSTYITGLLITRTLIKKHKAEKILMGGLLLAFFTVIVSAVLSLFHLSGPWIIVLIMSLFSLSGGFVSPTANACTLIQFRKISAEAAALISTLLFTMSSLTSTVAMRMKLNTITPLTIYLCILTVFSIAIFYFFIWKKNGK